MADFIDTDPSTTTKYVYRFGSGDAEGRKDMKALLGGKGANLSEMSAIGLPVPPGFTISTEACQFYNQHGGDWPDGLGDTVRDGVQHIASIIDQRFGDPENPLLISVRSGAAVSMPGMMDSVLNLGLNDEVVAGLAENTSNERFAYDAYRRLIDMFGDVVAGVSHDRFEHAMAALKEERGVKTDLDLTAADLRELVDRYKAIYRKATGHERHGRLLYPQPGHRRKRALRRVSAKRTGRRRGGRPPHAARHPGAQRRDADHLRAASGHPAHAGGPLRRHAGPGVHRARRPALPPANARRQTHRPRRRQDRRRHGRGRTRRPRHGRARPRRAPASRPAPPPPLC